MVGRDEFWQSPSGRLHTLKHCSGGAPANRMKKVAAPVAADLVHMLYEPGRPQLCRCAWPSAQRIVQENEER